MIYITGDTYGDISRFQKSKIKFKKGDTVIVCGNFGFYCNKDKIAEKALKWLSKQKFSVAFLHGAIDDVAFLNSLPRIDWNGGKAAMPFENVYFLPQGEVYEIEGNRFFCFGGGENLDFLGEGYSEDFYSVSVITDEIKQKTADALAAIEHKPDYILTHDAPSKLRIIIRQRKGQLEPLCTPFHQFLDGIWESCKFSGWFFGKYRDNHTVAPYYHCIYDKYYPIAPKK